MLVSVRASHLTGNPQLRVVSPESILLVVRVDTIRG